MSNLKNLKNTIISAFFKHGKNTPLRNGIIAGFILTFIAGFAIAATTFRADIDPKGQNDTVSFGEFNKIIGTLHGVENSDGVFKTAEGLVIEVRDSDPSATELEDGRMWLIR